MKGLQYALNIIDNGFGVGIKKAKQQTKGLDDAVNRTNGNLAKIKTTGQNSFSGIGKYAKKAGLAIVAALSIGAIISFGKELTNVAAKFEGMENAIVFASGQDGGKNLQFLDDTIKTLNLDMSSAYKGFQTLTGSLKGTKLEGQATRDIFEAVGVASTVMNLSAEQSEGAFLALSQMASKGKVQAEELRGQLGERIPGALKIAADSMGVSQQQFNKMLDSGQVYAEDFLPKFAKQLKTTFEGGVPKAAESMQAAINKKSNALLSFKRVTAQAFRPMLTGALEAGTKLFGFLSDLMNHIEPVKTALQQAGKAFQPVITAFSDLFAPMQGFAEGGSMAQAVMNGIASAIQTAMPVFQFLGDVLGFLVTNVKKVTSALYDAVSGLFESGTAGTFLTNILDTLKWAWKFIQPVVSAVTDVLAYAIGVVGDAVGAVMDMVNAIFEWGRKTEWVQRLLNSFVSIAKSVFNDLKEVAMNVLGGIGDLLVGVFTLDIDKIKSALSKGWEAVKGTTKIINNAVGAAVNGWNENLETPVQKNVTLNGELKQDKKQAPGVQTTNEDKTTSNNASTATIPSMQNNTSQGVAAVPGGGGTKHTTFNIESFVKEMTVQTTNLKENPRELRKIIERIFNEAFADIQIRTSNA